MEQFASCYKWWWHVLGGSSPGIVRNRLSLIEVRLYGPLSVVTDCATCGHVQYDGTEDDGDNYSSLKNWTFLKAQPSCPQDKYIWMGRLDLLVLLLFHQKTAVSRQLDNIVASHTGLTISITKAQIYSSLSRANWRLKRWLIILFTFGCVGF